MYRVILVDDERLILRGLSTVVPWAELGCEVAGTAHDGVEGLKLIHDLRPDIVMTDIRMQFRSVMCIMTENCIFILHPMDTRSMQ